MKNNIFKVLLAISALFLWSCSDDLRYETEGLDGTDCDVSAQVTFDIDRDVNLGSRATDGDVIQDFSSLCVLVYTTDGNLYKTFTHLTAGNTQMTDWEYTSGDNRRGDQTTSDDKTGKATFKLTLPRNRYYIYAVANMGDLASKYPEDIKTRDGLKSIKVDWNRANVSANNQMFGHFSTADSKSADEAPIALNKADMHLTCWMKRLVSKVTVAFDGTRLNEGVQIFIRDVTLHDIPMNCTLGPVNKPGDGVTDPKVRYSVANGVIKEGEKQTIQDIPHNETNLSAESRFHVCKDQHPYGGYGDVGDDKLKDHDNRHKNDAISLFLFENAQGKGNKDKAQSQDGQKIDYPDPVEDDPATGWKDKMPFGSYIEVTAVYRNSKTASVGEIKYRFMLGEDVKTDYNVLRNTHYKLTMCFVGDGNDVDWHIEFDEDPGIYIVSPQFISYLYNQTTNFNVKVVGEMEGDLQAIIADNDCSWKPWGDGTDAYPTPTKEWYYTGRVKTGQEYDDGAWNSFLSLRKTKDVEVVDPDEGDYDGPAAHMRATVYNKTYWETTNEGNRTFSSEDGKHEDSADGDYTVTVKNTDGKVTERLYSVPLYTRAKNLITRTGYTGNNPYVAYPRVGYVTFKAKIKDKDGIFKDMEKRVQVIQVRRLVNPKGVWRSELNTDPFEVTLMRLPHENSTTFEKFDSQGPWSAEVEVDRGGLISLSSDTQSGLQKVEGDSETPIHFTINFNGTSPNEPRCAIVKVLYHNYTCVHRIFVRQGYQPMEMTAGDGIKWHSANNFRFKGSMSGSQLGYAVDGVSPLDEGSLFRFGHCHGIASYDNPGFGVVPENLRIVPRVDAMTDDDPEVAKPGGEAVRLTWAQLKTLDAVKKATQWFTRDDNTRVARNEDFMLLCKENLDYAYGVLYGDGAPGVAETTADAYGFLHTDGASSPKGMRGCFVYDGATGRNMFFPIGASGHGHRKDSRGGQEYDNGERDGDGIMRYSKRNSVYDIDGYADRDLIHYRPLFWDLYKREGAVYWCKSASTSGNKSAWDVNYFTFDFEPYDDSAIGNKTTSSDACYIRCVDY